MSGENKDQEEKSVEEIIADALAGASSGGYWSTVPAGAVSQSTRSAIGVEGTQILDPMTGRQTGYFGFTTPRRVTPQGFGATKETFTQDRPPKYFSGDEDLIIGQSRENIAVIQALMNRGGLLGRKYNPGIVDDQTRSAFRELLGISNREGSNWEETLGTLNELAKEQVGELPTYQLSNPDDLKAVFRKTAQEMLGRNLQDGELNRLVETFQAQEKQAQQKAQFGGVVTQPPSAQAFAARNIEQDFGTEVDTRKMDAIFSAVDSALSGRR